MTLQIGAIQLYRRYNDEEDFLADASLRGTRVPLRNLIDYLSADIA
jgi:hypothetical protein